MEPYKNKESFTTNNKEENIMMYFVQDLKTYSPKNRACKKLLDFIEKFDHVLIKDEVSLDAIVEKIHTRVNELNVEHPKLKKIRCSENDIGNKTFRIDATLDSMGCLDLVFILDICKVRSIYKFSEPVNLPKKDDSHTEHCINANPQQL